MNFNMNFIKFPTVWGDITMIPEVQLVTIKRHFTQLEITKYLEKADLYNPDINPVFQVAVEDDSIRVADSAGFCWKVFVMPDSRTFYKGDPRTATLRAHRKVKMDVGPERRIVFTAQGDTPFQDFLPVFHVVGIANSNWIARAAKRKVQRWIKNEFTFLQTEAQ